MANELTGEHFRKLVPSGSVFADTREEFVDTGRRMMELEDSVYLSVISTPSRADLRPCSVQEYLLSTAEPQFMGTYNYGGRTVDGGMVVRQLMENLDTREEQDRAVLESLLGPEKAGAKPWTTEIRHRIQEGQYSQARIYVLKGGEK